MAEILRALWQTWFANSNPWWIAILTGYVLLSIAVLVLARLHWAQARRFSTCVVLAVFAHLLLVGALCLVKSTAPPGDPDGSDGVRVTLSPDQFFVEEDDQGLVAAPLPSESPQPASDASSIESEPTDVAIEPTLDEPSLDETSTGDTAELPDAPAEVPTTPESSPEVSDPLPDTFEEIEADPPAGAAQEPPPETQSEVTPEPNQADSDMFTADEPAVDALPESPMEQAATEPSGEMHDSTDVVEPLQPSTDHSTVASDTSVWKAPDAEWGDPEGTVNNVFVSQSAAIPTPTADADRVGQPVPQADFGVPQYALRSAGANSEMARRRGATPESEAAVRAALKWLADNQSADGRWDAGRHGAGHGAPVDGQFRGGAGADADTGITGLALLAFLSSGHTHLSGPYRAVVQHGLEFLMRSQRVDGSLAGQARYYAQMYCHGMATLALAEAYGMTKDERLRPFVEAAIRYIERCQHRVTGGWRYMAGEPGDMSQFGWQIMAMLAAERAGVPSPPIQYQLAERFLASVSRGQHGGLASYRPGEQIKVSMTAEALACRVLMLGTRGEMALEEAAQLLMKNDPRQGRVNLYYWYYATLGLCQIGGTHWEHWNEALQDRLLPLQRTDGVMAGSWDTNTVWGGHGGRVYTTAMATLCLEAYYRYAPGDAAGQSVAGWLPSDRGAAATSSAP